MTLKRRDFLLFMGLGLGSTMVGLSKAAVSQQNLTQNSPTNLTFTPIKIPLPLESEGLSDEQQKIVYRAYEVVDDLVLPKEFTYDVIAAWGDKVGDSRFGYNNDYVSFIETAPNEGYLVVNFEYISGKTWVESYEKVIQKSLPFAEVKTVASLADGQINAFSLPDDDPLKTRITEIAKEAFIDQGIGVISLKRNLKGQWERTFSPVDRRVTGISGLEDGQYLKATGPAVAVFSKTAKQGYDDNLGAKIIGTMQNCAGGTTPWGTVLSAEENFQDQVPEAVMADGSALNPDKQLFVFTETDLDGRGNVFGLAGNKYGWMVEIDPADPQDYGTKHTWLGRYRHEAVAFHTVVGKPLAVYSGCDRRGGHLYKFISKRAIQNPKDQTNAQLFEEGMLYGAKFNPDGTGKWIPLTLDTPIAPLLPSQVIGKDEKGMIPLPNPNRSVGGIVKITEDSEIEAYKGQFKTLGELYLGTDLEKQGAILIDAHFAANAAGITATARPEDTDMSPDGTLFIAYTSGFPDSDGGPDKAIFKGPNGEIPYEFGWIMRLDEDNNDPASLGFRWDIFATGGEPASGGLGFANPDNLAIDQNNHLWMVTDISTDKQNKAVPSRIKDKKTLISSDLSGIFGNNTAWFIPTSGENAGIAYPFAIGPMDTEICGLCFTPDQQTLFLAIQHPGEFSGIRTNNQAEIRQFTLKTTNGQEFIQERLVPVGSNWPSKQDNEPPRPSLVAVRRVLPSNGKI